MSPIEISKGYRWMRQWTFFVTAWIPSYQVPPQNQGFF